VNTDASMDLLKVSKKLFDDISVPVKHIDGKPYVSLSIAKEAVLKALEKPQKFQGLTHERMARWTKMQEENRRHQEKNPSVRPYLTGEGAKGCMTHEERKTLYLQIYPARVYADGEPFLEVNLCDDCLKHQAGEAWCQIIAVPRALKTTRIHGTPHVRCKECRKKVTQATKYMVRRTETPVGNEIWMKA